MEEQLIKPTIHNHRMGAYENPITVIDKESGKIWANAIRGIGEQTVKYLEKQEADLSKQQKEAQMTLRANAKYVMENQSEFSAQMAKNGVNNPFLFQAGKGIIDKMAMVNAKVLAATTQEESQMALNEYAMLQSSYTNLVSGIKIGADADETYLNDILNTENKVGNQGGMSTTKEGYSTYQKIMSIRSGFGKGAIQQYIDNGDGTWNTRFSGGILGDEIINIPQMEAYNFDPGVIVELDKEIDEWKEGKSGEDEQGNGIAIVDSQNNYTKEYLTGSEVVETTSKNGIRIQSIVKGANTPLVASAASAYAAAKAQSLLDGPYETVNSVWLEIFGPEISKNQPLKRSEDGLGISVEDSRRFSEAMLSRVKSRLPKFNVETNEIDYFKTTSESIVKEVEKGKVPEIQITREKAYNEIMNLVNDPEDFLARILGDDAYKIVETDKGKEVTILDVEVPVTYKLYDNASIERFFLREMGGADTKREDAKFMDQISYVLKTAKNKKDNPNYAKELIAQFSSPNTN